VFAGWLPAGLMLVAVAFAAVDAFVIRPAMVAIALSGRRVIGTRVAGASPPTIRHVESRRPGGVVGVQDPELGWQMVEDNGAEDVGASIPLLCSTPAGRCERLSVVSAYAEHWPLTTGMGRAAILFALAAVASFVTRARDDVT
jgi:hypothetical protein